MKMRTNKDGRMATFCLSRLALESLDFITGPDGFKSKTQAVETLLIEEATRRKMEKELKNEATA